MPRTFARVHVCSTNDHPSDNDKVKTWIENAGGTYTTQLTSQTTHLLCSKNAWNRRTPLVREARTIKRIKIVKFDWIVRSLTRFGGNKSKNRPLPTAEWEWDQRKFKQQQSKLKHKDKEEGACGGTKMPNAASGSESFIARILELEKLGRSFEQALQTSDTKMSNYGYTLYIDNSGFTYSFALLRQDTYKTLARYNVSPPLSPPSIRLPASLHPCPMSLYILPPGPFARLPIAPYTLPCRLRDRHIRRVPVSDPPVFAMQMYVSDEDKPSYQIVSITVDSSDHAETKERLPIYSKDTAYAVWSQIFRNRTGREWGPGARLAEKEGRQECIWDGKQVLWTLLDGDGRELGVGKDKKNGTAGVGRGAAATRITKARSSADKAKATAKSFTNPTGAFAMLSDQFTKTKGDPPAASNRATAPAPLDQKTNATTKVKNTNSLSRPRAQTAAAASALNGLLTSIG